MRWRTRSTPPAVAADPGRATLDDVRYAYRLLLKRAPDAEGLAYYARRVADGMRVDDLIRTFVGSAEYRERIEPAGPRQPPRR